MLCAARMGVPYTHRGRPSGRPFGLLERRHDVQANLPAEHPETEEDPRVPSPYADASRPGDPGSEAREGSREAVGIVVGPR